MANRWAKRSQEEKERILREQRERAQEAHVRNSYDGSNERCLEIYEERELPLLCMMHGWVPSDQYVIVTETNPMVGVPMPFIKGVCPHCKRPVSRVLNPMADMGMMDMAVIAMLRMAGRLKDNRGK